MLSIGRVNGKAFLAIRVLGLSDWAWAGWRNFDLLID